jgi:NAD+--asparagine ADP-ribosyltransferase
MNALRERPRMTVALSVAVVAVVVVSMLAGGALAGDDCPAPSSADVPPRTQR